MKTLSSIAAMAAALVFGNVTADAQITVKSNGQSQSGNIGIYYESVGEWECPALCRLILRPI